MNDARVIPRSRADLGDLTKAQIDDTTPAGADTEASRARLALEATTGRGRRRAADDRHSAERVFGALSPTQQGIAKDVFLRLRALGDGTQDTRRRAAG